MNGQVSSCQACHKDAEASTKASDNLLPFKDACVICHDEIEVKEEPSPRKIQKFNHSAHAKLGNVAPLIAAAVKGGKYLGQTPPKHLDTKNSCAACHHGIEQSEDNATAAASFPHMADCLVCHNKIDPPESCAKCHSESGGFTFRPASHTPVFVEAHSAGKLKSELPTCTVCHGRNFRCQGCH